MNATFYSIQSVFTLAIFKDLKNITKCFLDNNVDSAEVFFNPETLEYYKINH